jgi:hypothetical protein
LARRYPGSDGYAIHDDTTLAGEVRNIVPMFDELKVKWAAIGVDMQPSKCAVLRGEEHRAMDTIWQSRGFLPDRCRGDGIIALGTPIGAEEFRTQEAQAIVKRSELGLAAIQNNFQPALGMVLVRGCINLRPMHLMRTMHPDLMRVATTGFDRAVDSTIAGLLNFPELSHDAKRVRGLKTKDGGLGVMRTHATTRGFGISNRSYQRSVPRICCTLYFRTGRYLSRRGHGCVAVHMPQGDSSMWVT